MGLCVSRPNESKSKEYAKKDTDVKIHPLEVERKGVRDFISKPQMRLRPAGNEATRTTSTDFGF